MLNDQVTVIAEIGSNHDGDLKKALEMIDVAAECGADIAKFQGFLADEMVDPGSPEHDLLKQLEVPRDWYPKLMTRCEDRGIKFLSTATNNTTLDWMESFNSWGYKVASCNITHTPLINRLIKIGKPVIVSTGLANLEDIMGVVELMRQGGLQKFAVLHCVSRYPAEAKDMRLGNIEELRDRLSCPIGFSDHSMSLSFAIAAVSLGARIIEKHITLDRKGISPDHGFALLPEDFHSMVNGIREIEAAMFTDFSYDPETAFSMRRSLHYARDMQSGESLNANDIKITRPEDGMRPNMLPNLIGRVLAHDVDSGMPLAENDFTPTNFEES